MDTTPCPDCKNGTTVASHVRFSDGSGASNVPMKCSRCGGIGLVPSAMSQWIRIGRAMRDRRLAENRTLREEARRRCITAKLLSDYEFGRVRPVEGEVGT